MECSTCGAPTAPLVCSVCEDFAFCSYECSDEIAAEHHLVCYDKELHVEPLLVALGLPLSGGVDAIEAYLEHSDLTPAALEAIGGLFGKKKRRRKANPGRLVRKHKRAAKKTQRVTRKSGTRKRQQDREAMRKRHEDEIRALPASTSSADLSALRAKQKQELASYRAQQKAEKYQERVTV